MARFRAEHPEQVPDDIEHLINVHFGWSDDDLTTQEHYTGLRDLMVLLLVTRLL